MFIAMTIFYYLDIVHEVCKQEYSGKNLEKCKEEGKNNISIYIYYLYPCLVSKKEQNKCGNGDLSIGDLSNVVRKIIMYIFVLGKHNIFFYFQKGAVNYI